MRGRTVARRRARSGLWVLVTALGLAGSPTAWAEPGAQPSDWRDRETLTGDWAGRRSAAADHGVTFDARYTAGFWSNVSGGFRTGSAYEGFAEWSLEVDLEPILDWKGARFELAWYSYHGGQPSTDLVGSYLTQTVSGHETATSVRFYEMFLRQSWCDDRFELKLGQLAADTDFFVSEYGDVLLNGAFGLRSPERDAEALPIFPLAAPGAFFRARTADARWEAALGIYSADAGTDDSDNIGFGWSLDNGALLAAELRARRRPFGRLGTYVLGVAATSATLQSYESGGTVTGSYALYGVVDQQLALPTADRPGLGAFLRAFGQPQSDRNAVELSLEIGLEVPRPIPGRDEDVLALGLNYLRFSDAYVEAQRASDSDVSSESGLLELTYRIQLTGWLTLQPDLQLLFDAHFSRRNATVIGLRAVIAL